ncbi:FkbM family methyltransferase [Thiorhodococcus fuscus]|uniref:FkbM family methyltransferase n=1 Tax=Thiorhodococcus fuscus TaxID=527200 RepID=A0ABW4YAQ7_9GAMM
MMFDFFEIGSKINATIDEARHDGVTLFGAGHFARAVFSALQDLGIPVRAFVVSGQSAGMIDNVPVVSLEDLDRNLCALPMWLAVFNRSAASDLSLLAAACHARGIDRLRLPQDYFEVIEQQMGWRYWLTDRRHYADKRPQIERALQMLGDDQSRQQFMDTLRFRLGASPERAPQPSGTCQYYPDEVIARFASAGRSVVYVDGGAYDGDTLMQAAERLQLAGAYVFEPDPANFSKLARKTRTFGFPVTGFPCGLSNATEWLAFSCENGEASAIMSSGESRIQCVTLDDCLMNQRIDYIKLDIEGHELAALEGAQGIIARDRPVLAIAAYHRWDDIWKIPEFLQRIEPRYQLTYRIHESNTFDSVLYAVC